MDDTSLVCCSCGSRMSCPNVCYRCESEADAYETAQATLVSTLLREMAERGWRAALPEYEGDARVSTVDVLACARSRGSVRIEWRRHSAALQRELTCWAVLAAHPADPVDMIEEASGCGELSTSIEMAHDVADGFDR